MADPNDSDALLLLALFQNRSVVHARELPRLTLALAPTLILPLHLYHSPLTTTTHHSPLTTLHSTFPRSRPAAPATLTPIPTLALWSP